MQKYMCTLKHSARAEANLSSNPKPEARIVVTPFSTRIGRMQLSEMHILERGARFSRNPAGTLIFRSQHARSNAVLKLLNDEGLPLSDQHIKRLEQTSDRTSRASAARHFSMRKRATVILPHVHLNASYCL